jgi:transcriptional regulator with XRE-family HTH domain
VKPNASRHNPDPGYIRSLCQATGLSMYALAARLGLSRAVLYKWITGESQAPYIAQFALESLRERAKK